MRTFIAITLSEEIKEELKKIQDKLKLTNADVKWVDIKNIHLTLKFLGEVDEEKINKIIKILNEVSKEISGFNLSLGTLGVFPKLESARVIWVGLKKGDKETKEIAKILEEKLAKIGIPKEKRPFSSHITLGRVRSNLNLKNLVEEIKNLIENLDSFYKEKEFFVSKITLFKSTLTYQGPIYEILKEANLKTI